MDKYGKTIPAMFITHFVFNLNITIRKVCLVIKRSMLRLMTELHTVASSIQDVGLNFPTYPRGYRRRFECTVYGWGVPCHQVVYRQWLHPIVRCGGRFENGKPWSGYRVSHQQILKGEVLHFEMEAKEK